MGSFMSRGKVTRSQVTNLKQDFLELSETLDHRLPWIAFARNGAAALLIAGTVFMFTAVCTLFPDGSSAAGALATMAVLLHLVSFVLREILIIEKMKSLLYSFHDVVPQVMDTSKLSKPSEDGPVFGIVFLEVVALALGFSYRGDKFQGWLLLAFLLLLLSAFSFLSKISKDRDYELKMTCQRCANTLENLLTTCEDV